MFSFRRFYDFIFFRSFKIKIFLCDTAKLSKMIEYNVYENISKKNRLLTLWKLEGNPSLNHNNGQRFPNYKPWPKYEPRARSEVDNQKLSRHPEYYNVEKNATQPLAPLTLPCVEPVRVLSTSHQRSRLIWMCGSILVQFLPLFFLHLSTLVAGAPRNAMRFTGSPRNSPNCLFLVFWACLLTRASCWIVDAGTRWSSSAGPYSVRSTTLNNNCKK